ncbi:hypothetical protein WN51_04293 [Melipona quadrifasciata]|uniref:Uncharacterized protein n=1 Tax=Melipona quadrifasciata TaxID=166423 RepID=A0A0M8ZR55_9HYME|nr:hypothetical protein WN51_04293 [Melipona quadrifasciata]
MKEEPQGNETIESVERAGNKAFLLRAKTGEKEEEKEEEEDEEKGVKGEEEGKEKKREERMIRVAVLGRVGFDRVGLRGVEGYPGGGSWVIGRWRADVTVAASSAAWANRDAYSSQDTATEAAAVDAATTHQRATTGRHLVVDHNHDRDHDQRDRSTTIHLPTTPYHPVTIAADTNNNHDHHRNFEHHAAQRHDHWNNDRTLLLRLEEVAKKETRRVFTVRKKERKRKARKRGEKVDNPGVCDACNVGLTRLGRMPDSNLVGLTNVQIKYFAVDEPRLADFRLADFRPLNFDGITDNTVEKFQGEIEIDRGSAPKAAPTGDIVLRTGKGTKTVSPPAISSRRETCLDEVRLQARTALIEPIGISLMLFQVESWSLNSSLGPVLSPRDGSRCTLSSRQAVVEEQFARCEPTGIA